METVKTRSHRRWIAFTVIELLVLVAVVAVLLALLFIGLPRVRQKARERQCVNNLKHVGLAVRLAFP
jgi:type II secretory pathway pseudopilin PulG